ncbi:MAG: NAD(P)H-hydrate dehydratase [Nitrososphaerota archaeon]|nr:NAD(P)H-hydrate dehydratase [Nitrososphaerales archaeon]MDW8044226.1 NAD(P)H-hydrate dehydratase [Nitrososphaerota archaeon]
MEGSWITIDDISRIFKPRIVTQRKGENGIVCVVGGSKFHHGAPFLTASAALRSGVDLVYIAVPQVISLAIRALSPNFIVIPYPDAKLTVGCANRLLKWLPKVDSLALGSGMSRQKATGMCILVRELLWKGVKVLLDGEALVHDVVKEIINKPSIVTLHTDEFERLFGAKLGDSIDERVEVVKKKALEYGITILLKGVVDIISNGDKVTLNRRRSPLLSVIGTDNVLSGLVVGLMARGYSPFDAAVIGAFVNGLVEERVVEKFGLHVAATDLIDELPNILKTFDK